MSETRPSQRVVDQSIEVNAPAHVVWQALTEAEHLTRWFPPVARVEPGAGGSIFASWGDGVEGTWLIEVWEPNRALRLNEGAGTVDCLIEARGNTTVLRVVQSGFGADASFDDQYESTSSGWHYFLYNLKHYLERHWNEPRHLISVRKRMNRPREEVWRNLMGPDGLQLTPSQSQLGDYSIQLGEQTQSGRIIAIRAARSFAGTLHDLNDGLFFVELEGGGEDWHCGIWLSVYGERPDVDGLRNAMSALLPEPAAELGAR
jgi:uncharacterized protein YndB with AHSA1/START domain